MEQRPHVFLKQKKECLAGIDLSRKGSFDVLIQDLVSLINAQAGYFTTSSCSGRIAIVEYPSAKEVKKEGCTWLHMSHEPCSVQDIKTAVTQSNGDACYKFEAFVLHVQCATLMEAQHLLAEAVAAGHRNSGISLSRKGKIIVGIRSTHSLEIPLTHEGKCLVSDEYLEYIAKLGNIKMGENEHRITRFTEGVKNMLQKLKQEENVRTCKSKKRHQKIKGRDSKLEQCSLSDKKQSASDNTNFEQSHVLAESRASESNRNFGPLSHSTSNKLEDLKHMTSGGSEQTFSTNDISDITDLFNDM